MKDLINNFQSRNRSLPSRNRSRLTDRFIREQQSVSLQYANPLSLKSNLKRRNKIILHK